MNQKNNILIVDDDRPFADSLADLLRDWHANWIVATVYDAESAIEYIKDNSVDAVLVDWKLDERRPKVRGDRVIKAARAKDPLCGILIVSGLLEEIPNKYEKDSTQAPDDYIDKANEGRPLAKELSFKLKLMLNRRNAHREAYVYSRHIDSRLKEHYGTYLSEARLTARWITTVFTDIRGFSTMANNLRDQSRILGPFLRDLYQMIMNCTRGHKGIVDKFMGDGSMLLFGSLEPDDGQRGKTHAINAVRAALEMRKAWNDLVNPFKTEAREAGANPEFLEQMKFGIGIHTAEVLVGIISTDERDQFTAIGHGINKAKRFESFAGARDGKNQWRDVLISPTVEARVKDEFILERQPNFSAKGTDSAEWCWNVIGPKT